MQCPKCQGELQAKTFASLRYHCCNVCDGIMMTPAMVRKAKQTIRAYEIMDVGSSRKGKQLNKVTNVRCPFCPDQPAMNKVQDPEQTHILLEQCPKCERLFFDAGEFADKHRETLWDKVLDLLAKRRTS